MIDSFSIQILTSIISGIFLSVTGYFIYFWIKRFFVKIGDPVLENPYGNNDYIRDMPKKIRFIRIPIRAKFFKLQNVFCTMSVNTEDGLDIDTPGILHWQRQPRSGVAHPSSLHKSLKNEEDVVSHMLEFHFTHNEPIDIGAGYEDKVDLFVRIEDIKEVLPTISREHRINAGTYNIKLTVDASSLRRPIYKNIKLSFGEDIENFQLL